MMNPKPVQSISTRLRSLLPRYAMEGAIVFSGDVFAKLLTFFISMVLVRFVSPEEYSYFGAFITMVVLFNSMVDLGLNQSIIKFYGKYAKSDPERAQSFVAFIFRLKLVIIPVGAFLLFLAAPALSHRVFHTEALVAPLRLLTLGVIGAGLFEYTMSVLQARQQYKWLSIGRVSESALKFVYVAVFILLGAFSLRQVYIAYTVVQLGIGVAVALMMGLYREKMTRDWKEISTELFRFAKWLVVFSFATIITLRLDMLLVQYLLPENKADVGLYSFANRLAQPLLVLSGSIFTLMNPKAMALKSKRETKHYIRQSFLLTIPVSALSLLYMFVVYFVLPRYAPAYTQAYPAFFVLCVSSIAVILTSPISLLIYTIGKSNVAAGIAVLQLLAMAILDYIFITRFGAIGAALGSLVVWTLSGAVSTVYVYSRQHLFDEAGG